MSKNKKSKNLKRFFQYLLLAIFSLLFTLFLGYYLPSKWKLISQQDCNYQIYIHDTGIHTNIIVPVKNNAFDWNEHLSIEDIGSDSNKFYNYLSFGWGDRDFMINVPTLADLDLVLTFKALFLPTPSVVYVQGYQQIPPRFIIKSVSVDRNNYLKLMKFIDKTFQTNINGNKIRIANGHSHNAGFYDAKGKYTIFWNCNDWTATGLEKAGVNTPLWSGLSSGIMRHLKSSCDCTGC
ncbi:MAG: TIGR02117 family protein [Xenococcaceae cyanobacterium]